jgi:hypothetical protein
MLTAPGADKPFTLRRTEGKWRIPVSAMFPNVDPATLVGQAHQIEIQVTVMRAGAADVAAGKYASASEAIEDVKKRIFDAALADHKATSTTEPQTQP